MSLALGQVQMEATDVLRHLVEDGRETTDVLYREDRVQHASLLPVLIPWIVMNCHRDWITD